VGLIVRSFLLLRYFHPVAVGVGYATLKIPNKERGDSVKRFYSIVLLVVFSISAVTACGDTVTPSIPQEDPVSSADASPPTAINPVPHDDISSITILYNRIDWRDDMEDTAIVRSVNELDKFYEDLKAVNINELDDDLVWRFTDGKYNDSFFTDNFLVLITVSEISGSNRHAVSSISEDGDILKINIDREVPDVGTADMAGWLIIIELTGNYSITEADVIFTDVPVSG